MIRFLILALLTVVSIAACQVTTNYPAVNPLRPSSVVSANCRMIQHEMGATEVCGQPQRIVVLGPSVLESLLALGVQPAGFADHMLLHYGDYDAPSQQIPYLGSRITQPLANIGLAYSPSIEALFKVHPDLILGTDSNASQYETFSNMAPTLLVKWADAAASLRTIAQAVDRSEQAEQLLTATQQRIAATRAAVAPFAASYPKVLLLSSDQLQVINLGNTAHGLCSSLIETLGFQLVAPPKFDGEANSLVPISLETLPQLNDADSVILLGSNLSDLKQLKDTNNFEGHQLANLKQAWQKNAIAQSLRASKSGRVYFIPAYLCLGLPGPIGTELYLKELQDQFLTDL